MPPERSRKKTAWIVGGIAGGLAVLLAVVITVFAVYGPRPTRGSDIEVLVGALEGDDRMFSLVEVSELEGKTVVTLAIYVEPTYSTTESTAADSEDAAHDALRTTWEELPGFFDMVSVTVAPGSSRVDPVTEVMERAELHEEFGSRPSGLDGAPAGHDGSAPTEDDPGKCADDYCDEASLTVDSAQTLELARNECKDVEGLKDISVLPAPASVQKPSAAEENQFASSAAFHFGAADDPDRVQVFHHGDSTFFMEIICRTEERQSHSDVFTRTEYEEAA